MIPTYSPRLDADERLAALIELARVRPRDQEPAARLAFARVWKEEWMGPLGADADPAAWAMKAQSALSERKLSWLGKAHHKPDGAGSRLPPAERLALKRAALSFLMGLIQGDPDAFLTRARQLGGLAGLRELSSQTPGADGRFNQKLCRMIFQPETQRPDQSLRALLDLAIESDDQEPKTAVWLRAGEYAFESLTQPPIDPDRFDATGLGAINQLCQRAHEIGDPARWASFMAQHVVKCESASKSGREAIHELAFEAIERQGGWDWLLSGFGHGALSCWLAESDEAARLMVRSFATRQDSNEFWGVAGGFQTVAQRKAAPSCLSLYLAGCERFGLPKGADRNAPVQLLFEQGHWAEATDLIFSGEALSARQARLAIKSAEIGARRMAFDESAFGQPIPGPIFSGARWPEGLLALASIADPEAEPSVVLAVIMKEHVSFELRLEEAILGQSTQALPLGAASSRRLSL